MKLSQIYEDCRKKSGFVQFKTFYNECCCTKWKMRKSGVTKLKRRETSASVKVSFQFLTTKLKIKGTIKK